MFKPLRTLLIILLCLLTASCAGALKSLDEISTLHAALVKEFPDGEVGVNLNNNVTLAVTFVNSSLNSKDPSERGNRAQQTATLVVQHYPHIKQLKSIWVGFVQQETQFVVFHYSKGVGFYVFDNTGTSRNRPNAFSSEQRTTATYVPALKQTDVVVRNMQLEGDVNNGFSVTPHYTVPGNVTAVEPSATPPQEVRFDFSSSSDKSLFPGAPKIRFLADQKVVYETTDQFSTSKFDDKFSEYLSLPVPYAAFLRMTSGNTLKMTIGDREYAFSRAQQDGLIEMRAYVKE